MKKRFLSYQFTYQFISSFAASALFSLAYPQAHAETLVLSPGGNQDTLFLDTIGFSFRVGEVPLLITKLGVWDDGGNGLAQPNTVGIWSEGGTLLCFAGIPSGTAAPLTGGFRYASPGGSPVILNANATYILAAYAAGEIRRTGTPAPTFSADASLIGTRRNSSGYEFSFPALSHGSIPNQAVLGPNMQYTLLPKPIVTTDAASNIIETGARLHGTVNPNGQATTAQFEYGITTSYDHIVSVTLSPDNGTAVQTVSVLITELTANTPYHFRLTATNNTGTSFGTDQTFTTLLVDTDGDGIPDSYETGTGTYVSPTNTGTSPTNPDSDGDGLIDGQEVNTYHTNPNIKDTDGDGFEDGFEVSTGFDPTSDTSSPNAFSTIVTAVEYRFAAASEVSYRIEASTDLVAWETIETPIVGTGVAVVRFYSTVGQPKRFFRSRRN